MTLFLPLGLSFKEPNKELLFWGESPNDVLLCLLNFSSHHWLGGAGEKMLTPTFFPENSIAIFFSNGESCSKVRQISYNLCT